MRFVTMLLALTGALVLSAPAAVAGTVTFGGSGTVSDVGGKLTPTGLTPIGSALQFQFSFDPATASLIESDDGYALYELAVTDFSATLGGYNFPLSDDPARLPLLELTRGFTFFDGSFAEPSIGFYFYLSGMPSGSAPMPFSEAAGSSQQLALGGVLRGDEDIPLTAADITGLGPAYYQDFQYGTRDPTVRQSGLIDGHYNGSFAIAAVPEPATWALMIVGFGLAGAAVRRRRAAAGRVVTA